MTSLEEAIYFVHLYQHFRDNYRQTSAVECATFSIKGSEEIVTAFRAACATLLKEVP